MPTCWDEWFPELARLYSLGGAEILVYPTAIGSEPDYPDFDTQPLWQQVIVGNGIANGLFMVVPNRYGRRRRAELLRFLVHLRPLRPDPGPGAAGRIRRARRRSRPASSAATGSSLFPFLATRRPDTYARLTEPVRRTPARPIYGTSRAEGHRMNAWRMPAETAPQDRIWMAFPTGGYTLGDTAEEAHAARSVWAAVAQRRRRVRAGHHGGGPRRRRDRRPLPLPRRRGASTAAAQRRLDAGHRPHLRPRRRRPPRRRRLGVQRLGRPGLGRAGTRTRRSARPSPDRAGARHIASPLVNEGGGIHVDGEGTVLVTETVQLDPGRNPGSTKADVEAELARTIGATHVVWLPRGLTRDSERSAPAATSTSSPRSRRRARCWSTPSRTRPTPITTSAGDIISHAAPRHGRRRPRMEHRRGPRPANPAGRGGFRRLQLHQPPRGQRRRHRLRLRRPDRRTKPRASSPTPTPAARVVGVDARELFARGGGIHCITQQQPCRLPEDRSAMSQTIGRKDAPPPLGAAGHDVVDPAGSKHGITGKGLKGGQLGLLAVVVLGISTVAPAYMPHQRPRAHRERRRACSCPAIFLVGFIPMILVAFAYRELNADSPDSGTTFTWATKAFGPWVGWMGGWGLLAANIIVLSNLAGVAVTSSTSCSPSCPSDPPSSRTWPPTSRSTSSPASCSWRSPSGSATAACTTTKCVQYGLVGFQLLVLGVLRRHGIRQAASGAPTPSSPFSWDWFNLAKIETFGQIHRRHSLSIFVYWGWDVCLTVNEETQRHQKTAGRAGDPDRDRRPGHLPRWYRRHHDVRRRGRRRHRPEQRGEPREHLRGPGVAPSWARCRHPDVPRRARPAPPRPCSPPSSRRPVACWPWRTTGPCRKPFATVSKQLRDPGLRHGRGGRRSPRGFYAVMNVVSENVLNDTILALGLMICFYYGLTAFACAWYFRHSLFSSVRNFLLRLLFPVLGGLVLPWSSSRRPWTAGHRSSAAARKSSAWAWCSSWASASWPWASW